MMRQTLPFAAAALLAAACAAPEKAPEAPPPQIASEELDVVQDLTRFHLRLHGTVTSPRPAKISRAKWEMVVDGDVIKSGEEQLDVAVPAADPETEQTEAGKFEIKGSSQYVDSPEELKAMSARREPLLAALRGTLFISRDGQTYELPFAKSRDVRTPRLPAVVLHDIEGFYSDKEVAVQIRVGVSNPNNFPLAVSSLTYASTAAGKGMAEGTLTRADTIDPSSTGLFDITYKVNEQSHGKEAAAMFKAQQIPWGVTGQLRGDLFEIPYSFDGTLRINISR